MKPAKYFIRIAVDSVLLVICFFPVILIACSRSKNINITRTQVTLTPIKNNSMQTITYQKPLTSLIDSPIPTLALPSTTNTPSFSPTATKTLIPYLPPGYPATPKPTILPTPTPTLELPGALNRKDPLSLVQWLRYGLEMQDLSYIRPLLAETIRYSLAFSDLPGEYFPKETFLSELKLRLSNHPICISYNVQLGVINTLSISTGGLNPPWEFDGEKWDYLILDFSDQWTKEEGLYLFGAYVTRTWWTNPPDWISCR